MRPVGDTMVDGTYRAVLDTPLGRKTGTLTVACSGDGRVSGTLAALGKRHPLVCGAPRREGPSTVVPLSGRLSMLLQTVPFTCDARFEGDRVTGTVRTPYGDVRIEGERVRARQ